MRKLKRGDLVPWHGEVLSVHADYGDVVRLERIGDTTYHPEFDVPRAALIEALHQLPGIPLYETCLVDGCGAFGVQKRYWSLKEGRVLYDLKEWGNKSGHRDEEMFRVSGDRLRLLFQG